MAQLHQLLAVERSLLSNHRQAMLEAKRTLARDELFTGMTRTLTMFDTEREHENTTESSARTTSVMESLRYLFNRITPYIDALESKEETNMHAAAPVVIEKYGFVTPPLPATFLLAMETHLTQLREVINAAPTLVSGHVWQPVGNGEVHTTTKPDTFKSQKDYEFRIAAPATDRHPAQVEKLDVTRNVGRYSTMVESGALTSQRKHEMLTRLDDLINAVKSARQQANCAEVLETKVAELFLDFILND